MNPDTYRALGLSDDEYKQIIKRHGREPTTTELAMFSVEWSEHCGYMCSKPLLSQFPKTHKQYEVLVGEDSGAIIIDDPIRSFAVVFKMESHNHPSQIVPFHGAATGIGGIIRDIFTAGARPVALLDYLCFGDLSNSYNQYLLQEVVHGISHYGNCVGVPTIGGEIRFDSSYNGNCLVNVMCIGICEKQELQRAKAKGVGNIIMYVGAATGRDGIGGCSVLASHDFSEKDAKKPTVQIGDPFLEKCLIEATMELLETGCVVGIKDMGAAGLTCSLTEMAAAGKVGINANLNNVPLRQSDMEPWEIMMSESQERMLVCVQKGKQQKAKKIFDKWGLHASVIGTVVRGNNVRITYKNQVVADVDAQVLTTPSTYTLPTEEPPPKDKFDWNTIADKPIHNKNLAHLLRLPVIASKRAVYEQYDHGVQINTVIPPGAGDAAVIRIKDTHMAIAATTDCNSDYCQSDPLIGAKLAVYEAACNLLCVGAEPLAVTDCLNFGNPKIPDRFWYFQQSITGIASACKHLGIPVISGNVSFYNETHDDPTKLSFYNENHDGPIKPTPTIGMIGLIRDVRHARQQYFRKSNYAILLINSSRPDTGYCQYLKELHNITDCPPPACSTNFLSLQELMLDITPLIDSAHDCSDGGLAVALAECCFGPEPIGAHIMLNDDIDRHDLCLFNEAQNRIIISCEPQTVEHIMRKSAEKGINACLIGWTGGDRFEVEHNNATIIDQDIYFLQNIWELTLE